MGADASGGHGGGGSGGSVYITTVLFSGHGGISVNGGSGYGEGFGGAGGRIAVHVSWLREYAGDLTAYGGLGGTSRPNTDPGHAAGGTVYYTDTNQGLRFRKASFDQHSETLWRDGFMKLYLDNQNRNELLPTVIENENGTLFEVDEIEIHNHVVLWLHGMNSELIAHKFIGDRTGQMHLRFNQKMYCEVVESQSGFTIAPVSYRIDRNAEIVFPSTLFLLGTRTHVDGLISGVYDLFVAEGSVVTFTSTTRTALFSNGTYDFITQPGNISFSQITVQRRSVVALSEIQEDLTVTASKLTIKFNGLVNMNRGSIDTGDATIESQGVLNLDYTGYPAESGKSDLKTFFIRLGLS